MDTLYEQRATLMLGAGILLGLGIGWLVWAGNDSDVQVATNSSAPAVSSVSSGGHGAHTAGASMESMMHDMTASLEGKTGDAFDSAFLAEMIVHHEGAVVMAQQVKETSKRPELLKLADDIIKAQTGEIAQMKQWQKEWFAQ